MSPKEATPAPGLRRKSRETALSLLYQWDMGVQDTNRLLEQHFQEHKIPSKAKGFAEDLFHGVIKNLSSLDENLSRVSTHWRIDRMSVIDRNILRMAIFEILHVHDVPRKVSINEAIEIGKSYGTEDSGSFINGILDRFQKPEDDSTPSADAS